MPEREFKAVELFKRIQEIAKQNPGLPVRVTVNNRYTCHQVIHAGESQNNCKVTAIRVNYPNNNPNNNEKFLEIECEV